MKDGIYETTLSAYAYSCTGRLRLKDDRGHGQDDHFEISIRLLDAGHDLRAVVRFVRSAAIAADQTGLPARFSLSMIGSGGSDTFNLIGTGPRGIIVEIDAGWVDEGPTGLQPAAAA